MNNTERLIGSTLATLALTCITLARAADANQPAAAASMPAAASPAPASAAPAASGAAETGLAAVYSDRLQGRKTASGERYDRNGLTAAHKTLPFGTRVKVTHIKNQKTVTVRINDRGPVQAGRILDLSPAAARALGIGAKGMGEVTAEAVGETPEPGNKTPSNKK
jgi:rare lipoprotein A